MTGANYTTGRPAAPSVYLYGARGPASLDQRHRAQERIDRIWYFSDEYVMSIDPKQTLCDPWGNVLELAITVEHAEKADDRYTVIVTPTRNGHKYECLTPCCFQDPVAPFVIELVQEQILSLAARGKKWAM